MTHYFVDNRTQPDGAHEVHAVGCKRMASDKQYLGDYLSCEQAVLEARKAVLADRQLRALHGQRSARPRPPDSPS